MYTKMYKPSHNSPMLIGANFHATSASLDNCESISRQTMTHTCHKINTIISCARAASYCGCNHSSTHMQPKASHLNLPHKLQQTHYRAVLQYTMTHITAKITSNPTHDDSTVSHCTYPMSACGCSTPSLWSQQTTTV